MYICNIYIYIYIIYIYIYSVEANTAKRELTSDIIIIYKNPKKNLNDIHFQLCSDKNMFSKHHNMYMTRQCRNRVHFIGT